MADLGEYHIPELIFGLELEFAFAVKKTEYRQWAAANPKDAKVPVYLPLSPRSHKRRRVEQENETSVPAARSPTGRRSLGSSNSGSTKSSAKTTTDSIDSMDNGQRDSHLQYLLALLNRKLPDSPKEESLIAPVVWADPKEARPDTWHLTYDESVMPTRKGFSISQRKELEEIKPHWITMGGELVSCKLPFDALSTWLPMLEQIQHDTEFNGTHGGWFDGSADMHVHFSIKDQDLELATVKNLVALYGLYEREIEKWLPTVQRDNKIWCDSIRRGCEAGEDATGKKHLDRENGSRYTPALFTSSIYDAEDLEQLKTALCGWSQEDSGLRTRDADRDYMTVNISPARAQKPWTIEFRQHKGTIDPIAIKWWVMFCGRMLRCADFMAQVGMKFLDVGSPREEESFVENLVASIGVLDLTGFPEEGKAHFARCEAMWRDEVHDAKRALDELVIAERCRLVRQGLQTGPEMDEEMEQEDWWVEADDDIAYLMQEELEGRLRMPPHEVQPGVDDLGSATRAGRAGESVPSGLEARIKALAQALNGLPDPQLDI